MRTGKNSFRQSPTKPREVGKRMMRTPSGPAKERGIATTLVTLIVAVCGCVSSAGASKEAVYRVGVARVEITPTEPVRLSGYDTRKVPHQGVENPIFARALAFEDIHGTRALVLSVEAIGTTRAITEAVAARVEKATGLPRERLSLCVTHSHTVPSLTDQLPTLFELTLAEREVVDRYTRFLIDRAVEAAVAALTRLEPAVLSFGHGTAGVAKNRRRRPAGPVDQDVPVLRIASPEGRLRAVLYGYACHCTTLYADFNKICGDWAGFASAELERDGVVAACLIGCGADADPEPRTGIEHARANGSTLASAIRGVLARESLRSIGGPLSGRSEWIELPFDTVPAREALETGTRVSCFRQKLRARHLLQQLDSSGALPSSLPYPVQTLSFGKDLCLVFLGGEVVVDYALRLKRDYEDEKIWPVAYANDVPCYIPSVRILNEGGYEAEGAMDYYALPSRLAPATEELIHSQARALIPESFRRPPVPAPKQSPVTAEESLKHFAVEPGFEVELIAAEPWVRDPVHLSWDARGRMYVTEMIDYPTGPEPLGRIVRIEDTNGDGRMDRNTIFAEGLSFPMCATPWRNGVLVLSDTNLLYLEDVDGDGTADVRRALFTGFSAGNTQHRVNSLQWNLDNWIYGANGGSPANITSVEFPTRTPVAVISTDFRLRPDTGEIETLFDNSDYGVTLDDLGRRFNSSAGGNQHHVVLDRPLRDRNPFPPKVGSLQRLEGRVPLHQISGKSERFNDPLDLGFFTAASGQMIYRGGNFPAHVNGNLFIGESAGNLVHRDVLVRQGASFIADVHTQPREFLASTDPWFRPVYLATGPDGCLYIADMYRAVIEHPEWIPDDIEKTLDLNAGNDRGRIYRIRHRARPPGPVEPLDRLSGLALVDRLASSNGWVRDTAQRLLVERSDHSAVPRLQQAVRNSPAPLARVHALWSLQGMDALDDGTLRAALGDREGSVRETALQLAEPRIQKKTLDVEAILPLAEDKDAFVRLRAVVALGASDDPLATAALGDAILNKNNDQWIQWAAILSRPEVAHRILARVAQRIGDSAGEGERMLPPVWRLSYGVGRRDDLAQLRQMMDLLLPRPDGTLAEWQMVGLGGGLGESLHLAHVVPGNRLREALAGMPDGGKRFDRARDEAVRIADDERVRDGTRYDALIFLGMDPVRRHVELLRKYLAPVHAPNLQEGAIIGIGQLDLGEEVVLWLLEHWKAYAPEQRQKVLEAQLRRPDRVVGLAKALREGRLSISELDAGSRKRLKAHSDPDVRQWAAAALASGRPEDRRKVLKERQGALELKGRRAEGVKIFAQICAQCHPVQRVGPQVGPDLVTVRKRERAALLMDIVDPNASVAPDYVSYIVETKTGEVHTGLVAGQSAASVTLRLPGGAEQMILRAEIESMRSSQLSLMPEGLDSQMTDQALADLIEYLRQIQ